MAVKELINKLLNCPNLNGKVVIDYPIRNENEYHYESSENFLLFPRKWGVCIEINNE